MFGVYNILETIGQGGMGVVYRAHDTALDRVVALKVLKEDLRANKQVAARFQREAEAFASLNHPNIVHIYTVGTLGRIPYFAMEFIEGSPLSQAMKREKRIHWQRSLHIAQQIAEALESAHDAHIIHRDIKPGNILLNKDDRAYVTDFGIAKVLTAETQLTLEGSRLGTPQYMSPERCVNREITPASDLYSLGVVMFQMISGRLPYESSSPVELIKKIVSDPPARLSDYVSDVPDDVERLVAYLIEKKPEDRPPDAQTVAALCRRVMEGEPLFEDTGAASSIQEFREGLSTPTPGSTTHSGFDTGSISSHLEPLRRMWARLSTGARIWTVGAPLVVLAAFLGQVFARQANEGYALETVRRWDRSTAHWTQPAVPAEFVPESTGVSLIRLNLPLFAPARVFPVGRSDFAVELRGWENSARAGQASIVTVVPEGRRVRLAVPPSESPGAMPLRVLGAERGASPAFSGIDAYFFPQRARDWRGRQRPALFVGDAALHNGAYARAIPGFALVDEATARGVSNLGPVAVSPSRSEMVLAVGDRTPAGWQLIHAVLDDDTQIVSATALTEPGPRIERVLVHSGESVFFAQKTSGGAGLVLRRIFPSESGEPDTLWHTEGDVRLFDLRHDAALIEIALEAAEGGERAVAIVDLTTGELTELGPGESGSFHPDGLRVVVSGRDRRGNLQLWEVERSAPGERRQLTFLASGLQPQVRISEDGKHALGVVAEEGLPRLVLVNFDEPAGATV